MILNELQKPVNLESLLAEYFDFSVSNLTPNKISHLLETTRQKLDVIRNSNRFHTSERDKTYMGLLTLENLLTERSPGKYAARRSINPATQAIPDEQEAQPQSPAETSAEAEGTPPTAAPEGNQPAAHAPAQQETAPETRASTTGSIRPTLGNRVKSAASTAHAAASPAISRIAHTAGSALGAFVQGVKGNTIHKDWGKVVNTDAAGNPIRPPRTTTEISSYTTKILQDSSFKNLSQAAKQKLSDYIYRIAKTRTAPNPNDITTLLKRDPAFSRATPNEKKSVATELEKVTDYLTSKTPAASAPNAASPASSMPPAVTTQVNNPPVTTPAANSNPAPTKHVPTKIEKDVYSALCNQGFKKQDAARAIDAAIKSKPEAANNFNELFKVALHGGRTENQPVNKVGESIYMKKTKIVENALKSRARKLLKEGEIESAQSVLAAKDLVDRLADTISELGKMSNDELPALVDSIRTSLGAEQADRYQTTANTVINDLLTSVKEKKTELENATLVLSGDEPTAATDLALPEEVPSEGDEDIDSDAFDAPVTKRKNPLGRETRMPASESLINLEKELAECLGLKLTSKKLVESKKMIDAKIIGLTEALKKTDVKKNPKAARRLAEAIRQLATEAVKTENKKASSDKPHAFVPGKTFAKNCKICQGAKSKAIHQKKIEKK